MSDRDYFVVTDENGTVITTREIRQGVITEQDIANDVLEHKDRIVVIMATKEEYDAVKPESGKVVALADKAAIAEKVEEKKLAGEVYERPKENGGKNDGGSS